MAKKSQYIAWSPLRKIMKSAGAKIVSKPAVRLLMDFLENQAKKITEMAIQFAKHSNRKKISGKDVSLAIEFKN